MKFKSLLRILLLLNFVFIIKTCFGQIIEQKIIYSAPFANEVYLVWGINNWQLPVIDNQPVGTVIKDNLVYTPLIKENEGFSNTIKVPLGTKVDFIFYIAKGPLNIELNHWDTNYGALENNYFLIAHDNVVSHVTANLTLINAPPGFSLLSFSKSLLFILIALISFLILIRKFSFKSLLSIIIKLGNEIHLSIKSLLKSFFSLDNTLIMFTSISLALYLTTVFLRAAVTGNAWKFLLSPFSSIQVLIADSYYDYLLIFSSFLFFFLVFSIFRKSGKIAYWVRIFFFTFSTLYLFSAILNVKIVEYLGSPFNYRWLYYSDFLKTTDSKNAIFSNPDFTYFYNILYLIFALLVLTLIVYLFIDYLVKKEKRKVFFTSFFTLSFSYLLIINLFFQSETKYNKTANPLYFFLSSLNLFSNESLLYFENESSENYQIKKLPLSKDWKEKIEASGITNVLLFVLESTPAEYIGTCNNYKWNVTPVIDSISDYSVLFKNAYACTPSTNKSIVSLLTGIYPWLSYLGITSEHPDLAIPSISSILKNEGYNTAFFNSGDNEFKNTIGFLKNRSFDVISDFRNNNCGKEYSYKEDCIGCDGSSDECLSKSLMKWLDQQNKKPFFATLWTYQTHYPYFVNGKENYYSSNRNLNRYLNALSEADKALGEVIKGLKQRNILEKTLIVIVGDHGEAFGRHDQQTHASNIYEENLRVPLIFYNEKLFKGEQLNILANLSDIAPSILTVLEKKIPKEWQGDVLFTEKDMNKNVFFFAPYSDYWFGIRENNYKLLYNATLDEYELYDLDNDSFEENNIAESQPVICENLKNKLSAWVKYQDNYMKNLLKKEKPL